MNRDLERIAAVDIDPQLIPSAREIASRCACPVEVEHADPARRHCAAQSLGISSRSP